MIRHCIIILFCFAVMIVMTSCGSGGSTGPTDPDNPGDLAFDYCRAVEIDGQMHVQWSANAPTRGEIRYGREAYTQQVNVTTAADSHDVVLTGLLFHTRYIFRVTAHDSANRAAQSTGEFTTPVKASPEPVISNVHISGVTDMAATVTWDTDEPATTILYYGIGTLSDSVVMANMVMNHSVELTDLNSSSLYKVRPEAVNAQNLRGYGPDTSLTTAMRLIAEFPDTFITVGDTIDLPIRIVDAENLAGLRFGIAFDVGMVEVVSIEEGPFFTDNRGFIFFSDIRNSNGYLVADMSWNIDYVNNVQANTDADGNGTVAWIHIRGLEIGEVNMSFDPDSTFGLDMFANLRGCGLTSGTIEVRP